MTEGSSAAAPVLALIPAKVDLSTEKTQLIAALLVGAVCGLVAFAVTAGTALQPCDLAVLDTVAHIGTAPSALLGSLDHSIVARPGCGPLAAVFCLGEYCLWHWQSAGYRALNLCIHVLTTVLVVALAGHLAGATGRANSLAPAAAIWAGLLYAVSPGAALSMGGISGQPALLCALFSVLSVLSYVRLRLVREQWYLAFGLICFTAAVCSGPQAVVLPLVISLGEVCLFAGDELPLARRALLPLPFWMALFFLAAVAAMLPGHFYGNSDILSVTAGQTKMPIAGGGETITFISAAAAGLAAVLVAIRAALRTLGWRRFAWLLVWAGLAAAFAGQPRLPVAAILSSVPACLCLAFAGVPAIDRMPRQQAKWLTAAGTVMLVVLAGAFALVTCSQPQ